MRRKHVEHITHTFPKIDSFHIEINIRARLYREGELVQHRGVFDGALYLNVRVAKGRDAILISYILSRTHFTAS